MVNDVSVMLLRIGLFFALLLLAVFLDNLVALPSGPSYIFTKLHKIMVACTATAFSERQRHNKATNAFSIVLLHRDNLSLKVTLVCANRRVRSH